MDLKRILNALREERSRVEEAISSLEKLTQSRERSPGEPERVVEARRIISRKETEEQES